jgi:hypothetical protein
VLYVLNWLQCKNVWQVAEMFNTSAPRCRLIPQAEKLCKAFGTKITSTSNPGAVLEKMQDEYTKHDTADTERSTIAVSNKTAMASLFIQRPIPGETRLKTPIEWIVADWRHISEQCKRRRQQSPDEDVLHASML